MTMHRAQILKALGLTFATTALFACGEEGEPVDTVTTQQALSSNMANFKASGSGVLGFMAESEIAADMFGSGDSFDGCTLSIDPATGEDIETCNFIEEESSFDARPDFERGVDEMVSFLNTKVFVDANLESSTSTSATYLIGPDTVCGDVNPDAECVSGIRDLELRVVVTSPNQGDVSFDILLGSARHNPISIDVWQDTLAVQADLGAARSSMQHVATIAGEPEIMEGLPDTMSGRMRMALQRPDANTLTAGFSVLQAIQIADAKEGYSAQIDATQDAATMRADIAAKTIELGVNWGAIDLAGPIKNYEYSYDEQTGQEIESSTTFDMAMHLGGLTGSTVFQAAQDSLELTGIGLGQTTSTLDIDGKRVVSVDLNAQDGRAVDLKVSRTLEGNARVEVSKVDLVTALKFGQLAHAVDDLDVPEWALDETLKVLVDGATPNVIEITDDLIRAVSGKITISSTHLGQTIEVSGDQCLVPVETYDDIQGDVACVEGDLEVGDARALRWRHLRRAPPVRGAGDRHVLELSVIN